MSDEENAGGGSDEESKPKKRKIDLKSRLSNVRATGSMAAIPSSSDDPLAFPPPLQGSVPPPKMLSSAAQAFAPQVQSAFAPPAPEVKQTVQQQTIKIEETEILEERKAASKKTTKFVALGALVAFIIGFPIGLVYERGSQGRSAVKGATDLAKDVTASVETMKDLSGQLTKGMEQFGNDTYPDDLVGFMQKTRVAFDAEKFRGRGVGGLPPELLRALIQYTKGVEDLNKKKEGLLNQLSKNKDTISKFWTTRANPVVNFSMLLDKRGDDYFALLVPNKEPFAQKGAPPAKYTIIKPPSGNEKSAKDFEGKRLTASVKLEDAHVIPVDESSVARLTTAQAVAQLVVAMGDTLGLLEGKKNPAQPDEDTSGLIKDGEKIAGDLARIGK
jgi:hypothetical protein